MLLIVHIYIDTTHEIRSVNTFWMYYIRHGFHGPCMKFHLRPWVHRIPLAPYTVKPSLKSLVSPNVACTHRVLKRTSDAPIRFSLQNVVNHKSTDNIPPPPTLDVLAGPVHTIERSPLHHPRVVFVSVLLLQTMLIFVARSALNKQVHEIWFEPEDSPSPRGGSWLILQQIIGFSWLVYATFL